MNIKKASYAMFAASVLGVPNAYSDMSLIKVDITILSSKHPVVDEILNVDSCNVISRMTHTDSHTDMK